MGHSASSETRTLGDASPSCRGSQHPPPGLDPLCCCAPFSLPLPPYIPILVMGCVWGCLWGVCVRVPESHWLSSGAFSLWGSLSAPLFPPLWRKGWGLGASCCRAPATMGACSSYREEFNALQAANPFRPYGPAWNSKGSTSIITTDTSVVSSRDVWAMQCAPCCLWPGWGLALTLGCGASHRPPPFPFAALWYA